jgi:molybdenum cofactor cytidylyltransferase
MLETPDRAGISIAVLAAGASRRLGRPKQLETFNGTSLVRHAVDQALAVAQRRASVALPVLVVTGAARSRVDAALSPLGPSVLTCYNSAYSSGMASSLRVAVEHAGQTNACIGLFVLLCDQPLIPVAALLALVDNFRADPDRAAVSRYDDRIGVPAILPAHLFAHLRQLSGDQGARHLLRAANTPLSPVEIPQAAVDVDTPAQRERLRDFER